MEPSLRALVGEHTRSFAYKGVKGGPIKSICKARKMLYGLLNGNRLKEEM
jgi:hypothetical protein